MGAVAAGTTPAESRRSRPVEQRRQAMVEQRMPEAVEQRMPEAVEQRMPEAPELPGDRAGARARAGQEASPATGRTWC